MTNRRLLLAPLALLATTSPVAAQPIGELALAAAGSLSSVEPARADRRWRDVPQDRTLPLGARIADHLLAFGNAVSHHVGVMSDHIVALDVDAPAHGARLRVGLGDGSLPRFSVDSTLSFGAGRARIGARVALGVGGHQLRVSLPRFDLAPTSYRGDRGVELRLPLVDRTW